MNKIFIERCRPSEREAVLSITHETIRVSYAGHYPHNQFDLCGIRIAGHGRAHIERMEDGRIV